MDLRERLEQLRIELKTTHPAQPSTAKPSWVCERMNRAFNQDCEFVILGYTYPPELCASSEVASHEGSMWLLWSEVTYIWDYQAPADERGAHPARRVLRWKLRRL